VERMSELVKLSISVMFNNTLRLICFTVLAVVFGKWWIVLISALFFSYSKKAGGENG
jgi:hypothetical protein